MGVVESHPRREGFCPPVMAVRKEDDGFSRLDDKLAALLCNTEEAVAEEEDLEIGDAATDVFALGVISQVEGTGMVTDAIRGVKLEPFHEKVRIVLFLSGLSSSQGRISIASFYMV